MISLSQLWLPILLSSVLVFAASSLIHMVLKWHNSDYRKLANEDDVRAVIRAGSPTRGQYVLPHCANMKDMQKSEMQQKFTQGPVAFLTVKASGPPTMVSALVQWFLYTLVISCIAAYIACRTFPNGASFVHVFRVAAIISFVAYAGGSVQYAIWMGKPWRSAMKDIADALIYAIVTGAVLGWLWPR